MVVRGNLRSLRIAPFDRARTNSYFFVIFISPNLVERKTNKVVKNNLTKKELNYEIPIVLLIQTLQSPGTFYTKYFRCIAICLDIYFFRLSTISYTEQLNIRTHSLAISQDLAFNSNVVSILHRF